MGKVGLYSEAPSRAGDELARFTVADMMQHHVSGIEMLWKVLSLLF